MILKIMPAVIKTNQILSGGHSFCPFGGFQSFRKAIQRIKKNGI